MGMDRRYGSYPLKGYGSWVWIMGMDHGVWIACGSWVWIGPLNFDLHLLKYQIVNDQLSQRSNFIIMVRAFHSLGVSKTEQFSQRIIFCLVVDLPL